VEECFSLSRFPSAIHSTLDLIFFGCRISQLFSGRCLNGVNGDDEGAEGGRKRDTKGNVYKYFHIFRGTFSITRSFIASINGNFAFSFLNTEKNGKRKTTTAEEW
jgi:hypothetical protein